MALSLLELKALADVTQARLDVAQTKLASIVAEENRLRELLRKTARDEALGRQALENDGTLKRIGKDEVWNSWIGQRRRDLNMRLANVMVRKEAAFRGVQDAFGKAHVLETLLLDKRQTMRKRKQDRAIAALLESIGQR